MTSDNDSTGSTKEAFILVAASSLACISGSTVIFADVIWRWLVPSSTFKFEGSNNVLTASLGLSSGVMLFTALYRLLPNGLARFQQSPELRGSPQAANVALLISFIGGVLICAVFNWLIHILTSDSVVHCLHDHPEDEANVESAGGHSHSHGSVGDDGHGHSHHNDYEHTHNAREESSSSSNETSPLLITEVDIKPTLSILDKTVQTLGGKASVGKCMGYSYLSTCSCEGKKCDGDSNIRDDLHDHLQGPPLSNISEIPRVDELSFSDDEHHHEHHHHHVLTRYSHLLSIGIQTALAICVHKLPEGFLTFATTHADRQLGFSVFIALSIHNYIEGFTIAFPLYLALRNRWAAFGIAALLGGCSQPLGALTAYELFNRKFVEEQIDVIFGITLAGTAGFMSIIGFQMFGSCISFGSQQSVAITWVFVGMIIIGITTCLTG